MNETIPANAGYSKAVDIWALGVIAFMLLFGENPFATTVLNDSQDYQKMLLEQAAKSDIATIINQFQPDGIGEDPKAFIKNLLVLDERKRMNARLAVKHPWFNRPENTVNFQQLYEQAIRNWNPLSTSTRLVEYIKTKDELFEVSPHFQNVEKVGCAPQNMPLESTVQESHRERADSADFEPRIINETPQGRTESDLAEITPPTSPSREVNHTFPHEAIQRTVIQETSEDIELPEGLSDMKPGSMVNPELESAKDLIREDIQCMNLDWDFDENSIPRPNLFDFPTSDTEQIESSSVEGPVAPNPPMKLSRVPFPISEADEIESFGIDESVAPRPHMKFSKVLTTSHPPPSKSSSSIINPPDVSKYRVPKRVGEGPEYFVQTGDGFEQEELMNKRRPLLSKKRVRR
jgi:serine/threonine protein kinase